MAGTIGGGVAEAKCLEACRRILNGGAPEIIDIDLGGNPQKLRDGVCGGQMRLMVTLFAAGDPTPRHVAERLRTGQAVTLTTQLDAEEPLMLGEGAGNCWTEVICPPPLALIVGAGHIGRVLAQRCVETGFLPWVHDDRSEWLQAEAFPDGVELCPGLAPAVSRLAAWEGARFVALVTRGFPQDVKALTELSPHFAALDYMGIMGSKRRIATLQRECVAAALPEWPTPATYAPVGLEINAETPEEIAISIVGEMIRVRRQIVSSNVNLAASS